MVAEDTANYVVYRLNNTVIQTREMIVVKQEDIRDTIRNATLYILNEFIRQSAKDHIEV